MTITKARTLIGNASIAWESKCRLQDLLVAIGKLSVGQKEKERQVAHLLVVNGLAGE